MLTRIELFPAEGFISSSDSVGAGNPTSYATVRLFSPKDDPLGSQIAINSHRRASDAALELSIQCVKSHLPIICTPVIDLYERISMDISPFGPERIVSTAIVGLKKLYLAFAIAPFSFDTSFINEQLLHLLLENARFMRQVIKKEDDLVQRLDWFHMCRSSSIGFQLRHPDVSLVTLAVDHEFLPTASILSHNIGGEEKLSQALLLGI